MTEIFVDIKGYESLYQISNLGNVKSLPKGDGNGNRERILKFEICKSNHTNYHRVTLSKDGKTKRYQVHRLVASAFIPNPYNKPFVNHIDNNGTNNRVTNLEWCTQVENMQHSSNQSRQDNPRSLGGKAAATKKHNQSIVDGKALIGTVFGSLTILDYFYDTNLQRPRFKFLCKCSCGNTTEKTKDKLVHGACLCSECTYKLRAVTRKSKMKI